MSARTLRIARYLIRTADAKSRIEGILKNNEVDPKRLADMASVDPTGKQGAFIDWIFKNVELVKDPSKKIRWPEEKERTRQALQFFNDLKRGDRDYYGISQDINQFDLKALEAARRQVHGHPDLPGFSGENLPEGSSLYAHEGLFEIIKVGGPGVDLKLAMQAACTLGEGTEWCTRDGEAAAKSYLKHRDLFVIYDEKVPYAQFHYGKDGETQLMDIHDNEIHMYDDKKLYDTLLKLKLMPKSMYEYEKIIYEGKQKSTGIFLTVFKKGTPEQEAEIAKSARHAYGYASSVLKKPFPAGEPAIAKSPEWSYQYAWNVIGGAFPAGEPAIAKNPKASYDYARTVLSDKPFPLGEPAIAKDASTASRYAQYVLRGRFPLGEPTIAMDGMYSYLYALEALRHRPFPMGEPAIAKDSSYALRYAQHILKDPDPKTWGERYLAEHSIAASRVRKRHHIRGARP